MKKFSPPRYPFISLITVGPVFGLEGSVPFCLLFPPCNEINKPAANALVRAQCAAICLGKFVYLVLINFNNGAQPAWDPRWLSDPRSCERGASACVVPRRLRRVFFSGARRRLKTLRVHVISPACGIYGDVLGGSSTVAGCDVGLV